MILITNGGSESIYSNYVCSFNMIQSLFPCELIIQIYLELRLRDSQLPPANLTSPLHTAYNLQTLLHFKLPFNLFYSDLEWRHRI